MPIASIFFANESVCGPVYALAAGLESWRKIEECEIG
jgi:hypothetical protein